MRAARARDFVAHRHSYAIAGSLGARQRNGAYSHSARLSVRCLFFPTIRVVRCSALCGLGKCDEVSICALFRFDDASFLEFLQGVYPRRLRPRGGLQI